LESILGLFKSLKIRALNYIFFLRWTFVAGGEEGGIGGNPDSDGRGRLAPGQNILTDRRIHPSERITIVSPL
jgi:hypothetical protein